MSEVNNKLFDEFKSYLSNENYEVNVIGEQSIEGIKESKRFRFFFDYKYYQYCMRIIENGYNSWTTIFLEDKKGSFRLNHKNDKRRFEKFSEVIKFTELNSI